MKKNFAAATMSISSFLSKKRKAMPRPVENNEIFDHLFIKTGKRKTKIKRYRSEKMNNLIYE
jgi:hypothetical protein